MSKFLLVVSILSNLVNAQQEATPAAEHEVSQIMCNVIERPLHEFDLCEDIFYKGDFTVIEKTDFKQVYLRINQYGEIMEMSDLQQEVNLYETFPSLQE